MPILTVGTEPGESGIRAVSLSVEIRELSRIISCEMKGHSTESVRERAGFVFISIFQFRFPLHIIYYIKSRDSFPYNRR